MRHKPFKKFLRWLMGSHSPSLGGRKVKFKDIFDKRFIG